MSVNLLIFLIVVPAFSPIFAVLKDDFFLQQLVIGSMTVVREKMPHIATFCPLL